ncbi:cyclin-D3-2-like [Quercus suber]|uniref:cyclin-D3-2-like n=1 Tax=Quercus suber TaxID=58331 RepID=UPI0032DE39BC
MAEEEAKTHDHLACLNDLSCNEDNMSAIEQPLSNNHLPLDEQLDKQYCWLHILLSKEDETHTKLSTCFLKANMSLIIISARQEAVQWILAVNSYHDFSASTAVLSVNYLDQFLLSFQSSSDMPMKPWMVQLAAVACLSLAAKVVEIHVPLLFDLQVEKSEYVFRPKSIQKMELLVLSLLDWRMNPVTPLSFINHIIKMVPMGDHQHLEFSALFKHRVLSLLSDFKLVHYQPSIISAAVTLHVMKHMDFGGENLDSCKNELCGILQFNKEKHEACYQLIQTSLANGNSY